MRDQAQIAHQKLDVAAGLEMGRGVIHGPSPECYAQCEAHEPRHWRKDRVRSVTFRFTPATGIAGRVE